MRCVICDDNKLHADRIASLVLNTYPQAVLNVFFNPFELLDSLESLQYDLALLDISMQYLNGVEVAKKLNISNPTCKIIFITSYLNYATEVYDSRHINFILKSQLEQRLPKALAKAFEQIEGEQTESILLQLKSRTLRILQKDIIYIERIKRISTIHCPEQVLTTYESIPELAKKLTRQSFERCHNSFIVNMLFIKEIKRTELSLEDGTVIPISRAYAKNLNESFTCFVGECI